MAAIARPGMPAMRAPGNPGAQQAPASSGPSSMPPLPVQQNGPHTGPQQQMQMPQQMSPQQSPMPPGPGPAGYPMHGQYPPGMGQQGMGQQGMGPQGMGQQGMGQQGWPGQLGPMGQGPMGQPGEPMRLRPPTPAGASAFTSERSGLSRWGVPILVGLAAVVVIVVLIILFTGGGSSGNSGNGGSTGGGGTNSSLPNVQVGSGANSSQGDLPTNFPGESGP
jgi:serine/threonine-protein kinase